MNWNTLNFYNYKLAGCVIVLVSSRWHNKVGRFSACNKPRICSQNVNLLIVDFMVN